MNVYFSLGLLVTCVLTVASFRRSLRTITKYSMASGASPAAAATAVHYTDLTVSMFFSSSGASTANGDEFILVCCL